MNENERLSGLRGIDAEIEAAQSRLRHLQKQILESEAKLHAIRHETRQAEIRIMVALEREAAVTSGRTEPLYDGQPRQSTKPASHQAQEVGTQSQDEA